MITASVDAAQVLAVAARTMSVPRTADEVLDTVARTALLTLPGFDHAGVCALGRHHRLETVCGTDRLVWELDALQQELAEGPGVDAVHREPVAVAARLSGERRWPRYLPAAAQRGLQGQLSVRLDVDGQAFGCLTLYATRAGTLDGDVVRLACLFATHAGIAIGRGRAEDQLGEALATRKVIGQAIGIVSHRYRIPGDRAFEFLVRASQDGNVKLRDVAQEVVDSADEVFRRSPRP